MKLKDVFRRSEEVPDLRAQAIDARHAFTEEVARALVPLCSAIHIEFDRVGPIGGESDRLVIQVGADRQQARFYYINVYANGVMADPTESRIR